MGHKAQHLLSNGYEVFNSVGDCSHIDLIAIKNKKVYRIQIKTVTRTKSGSVCLANVTSRNVPYTHDDVDYIAAYVIERNIIAYVPIHCFTSTHPTGVSRIVLRIDGAKNNQTKRTHPITEFTNLPA